MCNDVKHDAASVEFDRARETPRRQTAVEAMLAMGFVWGEGAWRAQSGGDIQHQCNRWFIRAGEYLKRAQEAEAKLASTPAAPLIDASPEGGIEPVATLTIGDAGEEGTQPYFLDRIRETEAFGNLKPGTYQLAVCSMQATSAEVVA